MKAHLRSSRIKTLYRIIISLCKIDDNVHPPLNIVDCVRFLSKIGIKSHVSVNEKSFNGIKKSPTIESLITKLSLISH